ncbi:MAG: phosphatidylserine decarboxylase family protein [Anaerolineales bacterium]|nr:phosphatidylserine decarboxylase family protein [Anaerolineales bacterium]
MQKDPRIKTWDFKKNQDATVLLTSALGLLAAVVVLMFPNWLTLLLLLAALVIWGIVQHFFRDPDREVVREPGMVVGPADGVVVAIEQVFDNKHLRAEVIRISMFLSVWDVHVQRVPLRGKVLEVEFKPGKYLRAVLPDASEVNEYIAMTLETDYGRVCVKQISGIMARKCVNFAQPGDFLETGIRYGLIKFGSRVDLFLPPDAEVLVKVGDKVQGGLTRMANLSRGIDEVV